ncbi:hypothetical protein C2845_PM17G08400 [Panicum miliaceum]|uniref:Uncharacterized protein n=1 Tax=Panicum miliaceum TaxID=4540 RepID=A0A3L6Q586_PANMI|nr:hypothetical protein C2845_PM17G08400 [Panicum miliaceum]
MCSGPESGNEGGGNSLISKVSTVSTPVVEAGNSSKKQKSKEKAICSPNLLQTPTSAPSSESQPLPIRNRILPDCNDKQPMTTTPKTNQSNPFMFEMPVPSLKMGSLTPICSPTTENKLYAGVDLSFKMLSTLQTIDLNVRSFEAEYNNSPIKKKNANLGSLAPSHWALGLDHPHKDSYITHPFFEWLATTNSGELHR